MKIFASIQYENSSFPRSGVGTQLLDAPASLRRVQDLTLVSAPATPERRGIAFPRRSVGTSIFFPFVTILAFSFLLAGTAIADDNDDEDSPPAAASKKINSEKPSQIAWLKTVEEGQRRALREGKPVLVWAGAAWCPTCKKLTAEFEKPLDFE